MAGYDYDLFVIGAGSGGVRAARIAAGHGARVGICEQSRVGGTCVIRGCVPKKLMVYASQFAAEFADAAGYGWTVEGARFSWPDFIAAKDREIDRLNRVYRSLLQDAGVTLHPVRGEFEDSHRIRVGGTVVSAERILVATGGRPWTPQIPGAALAMTSDDVFHLPEQPRRLVIVGGGFIACEFAGVFNGLGTEVTLVYRGDRLLRGFDADVRAHVGTEMARNGVGLVFGRSIVGIERGAGELRVDLDDGKQLRTDRVLYATGRVPNVRGLGLERAGVEMHPGGWIPVDAYSRTSEPHVFAVGDVTNRVNLTPVAIHEAHALADTEFGGRARTVDHAFVPAAVFSQPPVGTVGYSEHDAGIHCGVVDVYRSVFRPLKHTLTGRDERTLMKLVVERESQRVVGLHVVGDDAPEIVQGFAVAVKSGLTKDQFDATIGIHPTAAEELVTMRSRPGQ